MYYKVVSRLSTRASCTRVRWIPDGSFRHLSTFGKIKHAASKPKAKVHLNPDSESALYPSGKERSPIVRAHAGENRCANKGGKLTRNCSCEETQPPNAPPPSRLNHDASSLSKSILGSYHSMAAATRFVSPMWNLAVCAWIASAAAIAPRSVTITGALYLVRVRVRVRVRASSQGYRVGRWRCIRGDQLHQVRQRGLVLALWVGVGA